jgi:septum formation protein
MFGLPKIYLASKSPRRRELLKQIGVAFDPLLLREHPNRPTDVNEDPLPGEAPRAYVARISALKAETGWTRVMQRQLPRAPVLAADTTVALADRIFGKPIDRADAELMLRTLSGKEHVVLTCVTVKSGQRIVSATSETVVRFTKLSDRDIEAYVRSGEPMDKAGGYAIQGIGQGFVDEIRGSYSGVVGLPLAETVRLLREIG